MLRRLEVQVRPSEPRQPRLPRMAIKQGGPFWAAFCVVTLDPAAGGGYSYSCLIDSCTTMQAGSASNPPPTDCDRHKRLTVPALRQAAAGYFRPAALADAWGGHLDKFPWLTFETYTYAGFPSVDAAHAAMSDLHRWVRHKLGHRSEWFQADELQARGAIHHHVLRAGCQGLRRLSVMDYWYGKHRSHARVVEYDPARGARYYLCKYVASDYRGGSLELLCDTSRGLGRWLAASPGGNPA